MSERFHKDKVDTDYSWRNMQTEAWRHRRTKQDNCMVKQEESQAFSLT